MITKYPYLNSSYYRYYPNYSYKQSDFLKRHNKTIVNNYKIENKKETDDLNFKNQNSSKDNKQYFDILGIKLYFDDILLLSLILFLYNEEIKDQNLFICLFLLLLS